MKYYPETVVLFTEILERNFPGLKPQREAIKTDEPGHLLWMLKNIPSLNAKDDVGKRGRWLGHINGVLVAKKLLDNRQSKKAIKRDKKNGYE